MNTVKLNLIAITVGSYPDGEATTNRNLSLLKGLTEIGNGQSYWGVQGIFQSDYTLDIAGYAHSLEVTNDIGITT